MLARCLLLGDPNQTSALMYAFVVFFDSLGFSEQNADRSPTIEARPVKARELKEFPASVPFSIEEPKDPGPWPLAPSNIIHFLRVC